MCGIFFSVGFENLPASVIDSVSHRGPDGRGWNEFTSPNGSVVMAHRRLAIVDLSEDGHQPMSSPDDRYWITYNGEIYNYLEIRKELEALGYFFKTKTDTEVLLKSYLHWGEACLDRLNGMFAFVIWDDKEKTFFAARDRFGVKPLYYYKQGNGIAFASEIKQFKSMPRWRSALNQAMANAYLDHGYCDHHHDTLYQNVYQVLPGHMVKHTKGDIEDKISRWYNLKDHIHPLTLSDDDAIVQFRGLFMDAIRLRLRSDVAVGACLSGGLDSSSIVATMREMEGAAREISTFSAVFPGFSVDEGVYIDELSSRKKLQSHKNYPSLEKFLEVVDTMLYHQDLPFAGTSVFAQWQTFQSAKMANVTVLLDGQGADESLLGYPGMLNGCLFDYLKKGHIQAAIKFLSWQERYNGQSAKTTLLLALQHRFPKVYRWLVALKEDAFKNLPVLSTITDVCLWHFSNSLPSLLRYEDRNSMAASRESRLPFLDYRLVEFILNLPMRQRFRDTQTKWVLRNAMKGINTLPILERKDKIGFATPEQIWWSNMRQEKPAGYSDSHENFHHFIFDRWMVNEGFI